VSIWIAPNLSAKPSRDVASWISQVPHSIRRQVSKVEVAWTHEWLDAEPAKLTEENLIELSRKEVYRALRLEAEKDTEAAVRTILDRTARAYTHITRLVERARPRPSALLLWDNRSMGAMVWRSVCAHFEIPIVHIEGGWLPNTRIFDPGGSYLDPVRTDWLHDQGGTDADEEVGRAMIARWRQRHLSKHAQGSMSLDAFSMERLRDARALLLAGQLMLDSSMIFPKVSMRSPLELLQHCQATWSGLILMKRHPISQQVERHPRLEAVHQRIREIAQESQGRVRYIEENVNIHALFSICAVVATINSNVGLEAAMSGRRSVAFGEAPYTGRGITVTLPAHLPGVVSQVRVLPSTMRFVGLLTRYLYPEGCWLDSWDSKAWWGGPHWQDAPKRLRAMWEGVLR